MIMINLREGNGYTTTRRDQWEVSRPFPSPLTLFLQRIPSRSMSLMSFSTTIFSTSRFPRSPSLLQKLISQHLIRWLTESENEHLKTQPSAPHLPHPAPSILAKLQWGFVCDHHQPWNVLISPRLHLPHSGLGLSINHQTSMMTTHLKQHWRTLINRWWVNKWASHAFFHYNTQKCCCKPFQTALPESIYSSPNLETLEQKSVNRAVARICIFALYLPIPLWKVCELPKVIGQWSRGQVLAWY